MDFFSAQDKARRKTWQLAVLFSAAVLMLIVLTNMLLAFAAMFFAPTSSMSLLQYGGLAHVPWETWALISTGVIGVIACATIYKYLMVRGGGRAIAESLGGTLLTHDAVGSDLGAKRLLNIVDEMAIASGTPVPPVYLIPEPSINAFAAGFTLDDAVLGINRGTIDSLTRDELQGVVAHEFSHILNGDMRINLRLIALLHGILFLGMIGYGILRGGVHVRSSRDRGGIGPALIVAVGLIVIGYGGTFFGKWIKAAVSRQREYLADAAAVQFTRNPQGIAGALKKIGGSMYGSAMSSRAAEEASHLFFGDVLVRSFGGLFATHPPLDDRIRAIEPNWNGQFQTPSPGASVMGAEPSHTGVSNFADRTANPIDRIGTTDAEALDHAQALIQQIGATLMDAAHDPYVARALIYAMLIGEGSVATEQMHLIEGQAETGVPEHVGALRQTIAGHDELQRIALIELSVPTLKALSPQQYQRFMKNVSDLIKADAKVELFEWVLYRVLSKELAPHFGKVRPPRTRYRTLKAAADHTRVVLGAVALAAEADHETLQEQLKWLDAADDDAAPFFDLAELNSALGQLRHLHPLKKPILLKAASSMVSKNLTPQSGALLHGIAATLDCPLPLAAVS